MRLDLHVHMAASGGHADSFSDRFRRSLPFRYLARGLGISGADDGALTRAYADGLVAEVEEAAEIDAIVALAFDRPYSEAGVPLKADLHVPDQAVAELCGRSKRIHLGASVHPYRTDALDALDQAKAMGAVLIKWLPNTQAIDPGSPLCGPFYRRLRELALPLLAHTGDEHTLPDRGQALGDPARLEPALAAGVTVIAAHAMIRGGLRPRSYLKTLFRFCAQYPNLYIDCSGCAVPGRYAVLRELLRERDLRDRWVYGSDYPVPIFWPWLWGRSDPDLRRQARRATNRLDAAALALSAAGVPEQAFRRGANLCGLG